MTSNLPKYQAASFLKEILYMRLFWCKIENFAKSAQIWSQHVPLVLTKKTSTHTLCSDHKQRSYLEFKVAKSCVMSAIAVERLLTWTNRRRIGVAHHVTALIFYNITRCYGKHMAVFAVAEAAGDIIKYQSFIYGSFVWGIHVRYNNLNTHTF